MGDDNNSGGCGCCGCLTAIVIGTAVVGTFAVGGLGDAWLKLKSTWDYDNSYQTAQKIADKDNNGQISKVEWTRAYNDMGLKTIEGEIPTTKIPYKSLVKYNEANGQ